MPAPMPMPAPLALQWRSVASALLRHATSLLLRRAAREARAGGGAAWRLRLLTHVRANREHALAVLATLPGVRATCPEASYLIWLDVTDALPDGVPPTPTRILALTRLISSGRP